MVKEDMTEEQAQRLAEACTQHMYDGDRASQTMGMVIESVSPGKATLSMPVREDMLNGHNICHGGYIFALADSAFAFACNSYNNSAVGAGAQIDYMAPGKRGDRLTAIATECHVRGRSGIYDVVVHNQNGEKLAFFRGNSRQVKGQVLEGGLNND